MGGRRRQAMRRRQTLNAGVRAPGRKGARHGGRRRGQGSRARHTTWRTRTTAWRGGRHILHHRYILPHYAHAAWQRARPRSNIFAPPARQNASSIPCCCGTPPRTFRDTRLRSVTAHRLRDFYTRGCEPTAPRQQHIRRDDASPRAWRDAPAGRHRALPTPPPPVTFPLPIFLSSRLQLRERARLTYLP